MIFFTLTGIILDSNTEAMGSLSAVLTIAIEFIAFSSERRGQDWHNMWIQELPKWPADGEGIVPETPDEAASQRADAAWSTMVGK